MCLVGHYSALRKDMVGCEADLGNADLMAWASPHKAAPIEGPALAT